MIILFVWLIVAAVSAWAGNKIFSNKGRNGILGAIIAGIVGFLFSVPGSVIILAIMYFGFSNKSKVKTDGYAPQGGFAPMAAGLSGHSQPPVTPAKPISAPPQESAKVQRIKELDVLKTEGLISESEYQTMRRDILKS